MKALDLLRIGDLFDSLGWATGIDVNSQFPDAFESFCRMYCRLSASQQELLLSLSKSYRWIKPRDLEAHFFAVWQAFVQGLPTEVRSIQVAPLLKKSATRPKSSDHMFSIASAYERKLRLEAREKDVRLRKSVAYFAKNRAQASENVFVLIDDYLGSGDTALSALASMEKMFGGTLPQTYILVVAAQRSAIQLLQSKGCRVVTGFTFERAISDSQSGQKDNDLVVMKDIGRYLQVKAADALGYKATEALVTMLRTPNNTFPVYWTNKKVKGVVWDSPFTRYTGRGR